MKFELAGTNRAKEDSKGDVRIQIVRTNKGLNVKGNISKSLTIKNVKVSELHSWFESQIKGTAKKAEKAEKAAVEAAE